MGEFKMSGFKREPRYVVFKIKDIQEYLTHLEMANLDKIGNFIAGGREADGKQPFNAVVVEQDWPEFEPTWAAIEKRMMESNAVATEREACAKVCEDGRFLYADSPAAQFGKECAAAIRRRV
jgi:hypothetical protein